MNRLECIQYLLDNAHTGSEWEEAGMFTAIREVMAHAGAGTFASIGIDEQIAWLNELLERARSN